MRFVTVRELRAHSAEVWRRLVRERDLVITSNGKPMAILSAVSPDDLEESLAALRCARAMAAVEAMQRQSVEAGADRISREAVETEISAVRKQRTKRS